MKKFTVTKLTAQEMLDQGIDKNIFLTSKSELFLYTSVGLMTIFIIGVIIALNDPSVIATLFN